MLLFLLLWSLLSPSLGSEPSPIDVPTPEPIELFLGRCNKPTSLDAYLKKDDYESNCKKESRVTQIRIQPVTKRNWNMEVAVLEDASDKKLSIYFGDNLALRFPKEDKVERTIEGVTEEKDAVYEPLTTTKLATYNFSLTHSKDLFDFVAPDGNLIYKFGDANETVTIKPFWEAIKLIDIHNATDTPTDAKESKGLSGGALAAIIIGAIVALVMICLAIRYLLIIRRRRLEPLTLDRTDPEKKGPTPPSRTPTGRTPTNKQSRAPHEITGTEITGFTSTAGTNGPGRTGFTGARLSTPTAPTIPTIPSPWTAGDAQSPK